MGPQAGESEHVSPLRAISQFVIVCVSCGHEPVLFSKLDVLGAHFSGKGVKIWGALVEFTPGRISVLSSFPIASCHTRSGIYGKIMSQLPLLTFMWVFSHLVMWSTQLVFRVGLFVCFSRGNCFICSCIFGVSMGGEGMLPS